MKNKLTKAKTPPPRFPSDEAAANYFDEHSVAEAWESLPAARAAKPSPTLADSIRSRHARLKTPISLRLDQDQILAAKRIATAKSVGYQTQLRIWIAEGIQRESKRT